MPQSADDCVSRLVRLPSMPFRSSCRSIRGGMKTNAPRIGKQLKRMVPIHGAVPPRSPCYRRLEDVYLADCRVPFGREPFIEIGGPCVHERTNNCRHSAWLPQSPVRSFVMGPADGAPAVSPRLLFRSDERTSASSSVDKTMSGNWQ